MTALQLTQPPADAGQQGQAWYAPWQRWEHAAEFDFRVGLDGRNLIRMYETLNDVRLLNQWFDRSRRLALFEIGCATGDFYRYLRLTRPSVDYLGTDISEPAIARATTKYPTARFLAAPPGANLAEMFGAATGATPDVVYAKDVVHHQPHPRDFLARMLAVTCAATILRCRTRDMGATEWNPECSRQRQPDGQWVPYIVINLHELIADLQQQAPSAELVIYRSYVILGGQYGRDLPPGCASQHAGTAETAIGVFRRAAHPRRVTIKNRPDNRPHTTLEHKFRSFKRRLCL